MTTPLPRTPSLDGPKRLTYLGLALCLVLLGLSGLTVDCLQEARDWVSVIIDTLTALLGVWLIMALRQLSALPEIERQILLSCSVLYVAYHLAALAHLAPLSTDSLSELLVVALGTSFLLFEQDRRSLGGLAVVLGVHLVARWWPLLNGFNWTDAAQQLARDLIVVTTLLLIGLMSRHRTAWTQARDSAIALRAMALTDDLTGLPNRRAAYRAFEEAMHDSQTRLSVLLIDIDNFKRVNDTYGHEAGDDVIKQITQSMQAALGQGGLLVRWGGEEYLALLIGTPLEQAVRLGEVLRVTVQDQQSLYGHITVSVGVSARQPGDTVQSLVRRADQGLYRAKNSGKNQVLVYGE